MGDYILDCALGFLFLALGLGIATGDATGLLLAVYLGILPGSS